MSARFRVSKPMRAASSAGTDVILLLNRFRNIKSVRAPTSVGTDVISLVFRFSLVSDGPRSPRLGGSAPVRLTNVGACP